MITTKNISDLNRTTFTSTKTISKLYIIIIQKKLINLNAFLYVYHILLKLIPKAIKIQIMIRTFYILILL